MTSAVLGTAYISPSERHTVEEPSIKYIVPDTTKRRENQSGFVRVLRDLTDLKSVRCRTFNSFCQGLFFNMSKMLVFYINKVPLKAFHRLVSF